MNSDDDVPGLRGSESESDDYSDNDPEEKHDDDDDDDDVKFNSDEAPDLCSTDDESFDEEDERKIQERDVSNKGVRKGDMKKAAETWTAQFSKRSKAKDLDEYMDVVKKKVFGPIVFGQDEQLDEPWLEALSKFGLTQSVKLVPDRLKNEETVSRVVDIVTRKFKTLPANQLEIILGFANKVYKSKPGEINALVGNRLPIDCLWRLKDEVDTILESDEYWELQLGDRKTEKIVLIILISMLHYTYSILIFFHFKINSAREFLQAVSSDQSKDSVQTLRQSGNECFKKQNFRQAIKDYTEALEIAPYNHFLYSNRATCHFQLKDEEAARADAFRTYIIDPTWHKGYVRWAGCLQNLGQEVTSYWVIKEGLRLTTEMYNNADNREKLEEMRDEYNVKFKVQKDAQKTRKEERPNRDAGMAERKKARMEMEDEAPPLSRDSDSSYEDDGYEDPVVDPDRKRVPAGATAATPTPPPIKKKETVAPPKAQPKRTQEAAQPENRNRPKTSDFVSSTTSHPFEKTEFEKNEELRVQFKQLLAAGSRGLRKEVSREAVTSYEKALEFLKNHDKKVLYYDEIDEIILKYCMGLAHIDSGVEKNIHNAISAFKEIGELEGKNYVFAFLGLGKAYMKLNHYHEAIPWVERGLDAVKNGVKITGRRSVWPGLTDELIEETDEAKLKDLLSKMMYACTNPPQPEGRCGFEECRAVKREIYYSDVPFSGFITLRCDERCSLDFHRNCWSKHKTEKNVKSNKEFLGGECPTPDCVGIVIKFLNTDHTTKQSKLEYQKPETREDVKEAQSKAKMKTHRAQPSKENLKRKLERKEEKKRQKMAAKQVLEEPVEGATGGVVEEKEVFIPDEDEMIKLKSKDDEDDGLSKVTKKQKHKNKDAKVKKENKEKKGEKLPIPIVFTDQHRPLQSEKNLPRFLNQDPPTEQASPFPPIFSPAMTHGARATPEASTPPPAPAILDISPASASQESTVSGDSIYSSFGASDSGASHSSAQTTTNSETSGQQSVESILVWCQSLLESRGPMLVSDMDPHLSELSVDFQTVLADFGLSEIIANDAKKRCLILKDEKDLDYVYYTPEQFDYARKLYLDTKNLEAERAAVALSLREQNAGNTDTIVFTKMPSPLPREQPKEKLTLSSVSSILTKPKPGPSLAEAPSTELGSETAVLPSPGSNHVEVRKAVDELKDEMQQCCSLLTSAATQEPGISLESEENHVNTEDHINLNAPTSQGASENLVERAIRDLTISEVSPTKDNGDPVVPPTKDANGDSNLKTKVENLAARIDSIQGEISDNAAEKLAKLELEALKALVTIAPSVITVGNLHFNGSPEQMTITHSGVSIVLYKEKLFRPSLGNPATHLTKSWPVRLKIDMKFIKRVIGQWKDEPFKLFFAITSAGGKSINDTMGLVKFSEDINRPQFNPDSYDNRIKWIAVTFSHPSGFEGFEVIFKYASSSLGYNGADVGPSLLKHLSMFEANALYNQLCSTIEETEKNLYFSGALLKTDKKPVANKEVGTSLSMMEIEKLEGYPKLVKDMEVKEKNYELEIGRMKDEVKKKDTEKKRVDKELTDTTSRAAQKSTEVVDLLQKKSEMEKKLQNKISEKEKELNNFRGKNKELEQSITAGQNKIEVMNLSQQTMSKECQSMVKKWLMNAVQDHSDYEDFIEKQLSEMGLGESQARVKLRQLVKDSSNKKRDLNKSLAIVDGAIREGKALSEELKRLYEMPRVTLDYGPILNILVEHHVTNARNNNVGNDGGESAMAREIARSTQRPASMEPIVNPSVATNANSSMVKESLPGSYPNLNAPPVSMIPNSVAAMVHTGIPLRANIPIPPSVSHLPPFGPFGQPPMMPRPVMPTIGPPVRGPSIVVPRSIAPVHVPYGNPVIAPPIVNTTIAPPGVNANTPPPPAAPIAPAPIAPVPVAPASVAPATARAGSGVNKLIEDVKALHPEVEADTIKYIVTEFRKERGGKLSGIKMSDLTQIISTRLREKLGQFTRPQPATRYVPPSNLDDTTKFTGVASGDDCSICLETFLTPEEIFPLPECKHPFHKHCIKKWLRTKSTCPLCQKHTKLDEDFPALN